MTHILHNPASVPAPSGGYAHAVEIAPNLRTLFVSGQIAGAEVGGEIPPTFEAQCERIWANLGAILHSADMEPRDIVKLTTYLTNREQMAANGRIRRGVLGDHTPASTVVVVQLLQTAWLLEIELIAAKAV